MIADKTIFEEIFEPEILKKRSSEDEVFSCVRVRLNEVTMSSTLADMKTGHRLLPPAASSSVGGGPLNLRFSILTLSSSFGTLGLGAKSSTWVAVTSFAT